MTKIKTVAITLVTLIIAFFGVQSIIAEEKGKAIAKIASSEWHFIGTSTSDILLNSMWQVANPLNDCDTENPEALPCKYTVSDEEVTSPTELITYFYSKYPLNTSASVTADADSWRPEE